MTRLKLTDYFSEYDIILLLIETWIKLDLPLTFDIPGYKSIIKCRPKSNSKAKRGSGGLICCIKNEYLEGIQHRSGTQIGR